jgi:hypothetical protein
MVVQTPLRLSRLPRLSAVPSLFDYTPDPVYLGIWASLSAARWHCGADCPAFFASRIHGVILSDTGWGCHVEASVKGLPRLQSSNCDQEFQAPGPIRWLSWLEITLTIMEDIPAGRLRHSPE